MNQFFEENRICILCIWVLLFPLSISSQYSIQNHIHYTVNDGLPSLTCYDILQDSSNYIWIGTEGGLVRFNGNEFKTYNTSNGLQDNEVTRIAMDSKQRIWLQNVGNLGYMENDSFHIANNIYESQISGVFNIAENKNTIFVNNNKKLLKYDLHTLEFISEYNGFPANGKFHKLLNVNNDTLNFVVNGNNYRKVLDGDTLDSQVIPEIDLTIHTTRKRIIAVGNKLIYNDHNKIESYDTKTKKTEILFRKKEIANELLYHEGDLWILYSNEIYQIPYDDDSQIKELVEYKLSTFGSTLFFDKNDNLWIPAYKNGLYFIPKISNGIKNIDLSPYGSNYLESIDFANNKTIIGTQNSNFIEWEDGNFTSTNIDISQNFKLNRIFDFLILGSEEYLIASDRGLVYKNHRKYNLIFSGVYKNLHKTEDTIFLVTHEKVFKVRLPDLLASKYSTLAVDQVYNDIFFVDKDRSYCSFKDSQNNIWTAGIRNKLTRRSQNDTLRYSNLSPIFNSTVTRIMEMDNGIIVVCTKGSGIILINGKDFIQIDQSKGLSSNFCYDIDINESNIFVASNRGVSIIHLKDDAAFSYTIHVINKHTGLTSNEVLDLKFGNDTIRVATDRGLSLVPYADGGEFFTSNREVTNIEKVVVNGVDYPVTKNLTLDPSKNNIAIHYTSSVFGNINDVKYNYRMEGVDDDWLITHSRVASYGALTPGKYSFKVGSVDYNELESRHVDDTINITITPAFYDTRLFQFSLILSLGVLLYFMLNLFQSRKNERKLNRLVEEKTKDVNDKVSKLESMNKQLQNSNKELEQFAYITSHDLQDPVNTIAGFNKILQKNLSDVHDPKTRKILDFMNEATGRMKEMINDILEYSKIGNEPQKEYIETSLLVDNIIVDLNQIIQDSKSDVKHFNLPIVYGYKQEIRSLFQNIISNAIKFVPEETTPKIEIRYKNKGTFHAFEISDNGIGIPDEKKKNIFDIFNRLHSRAEYQGTGIGLANCKKIAELHEGEIWVEDNPRNEQGSIFKFTLKKVQNEDS